MTVIVLDPEPFTEGGLNPAVVPEGRPVTLRPTVPVNAPKAVTVAVYEPLNPGDV